MAEPNDFISNGIPQKGSLTCKERGIFPNTLHHYGLRSGIPYYSLTTLACNMPGVSHSATLGIQPSCSVGKSSEHYLVAFYNKLSAAAGLFFLTPGPTRGNASVVSKKLVYSLIYDK